MCGLGLVVAPQSEQGDALRRSLHEWNAERGPDAQGVYATTVGGLLVTLGASVLGLRGEVTPQPLVGKKGVLAWNGQVFEGLPVAVGENDTKRIFERLEDGEDVVQLLSHVEGPWAFVYLCFETKVVYFGVDPLSRRSMLIHDSKSQFVITSSRSSLMRERGIEMRALDGGQMGQLDLNRITVTQGMDLSTALSLSEQGPVSSINRNLPSTAADPGTSAAEAELARFIDSLAASVRRRVENIPYPSSSTAPRVALLFSGGVDCTLLAGLVHRVLPPSEAVELVNVAFEQPDKKYDVPDRLSGGEVVDELRRACPREWRFVEVDVDLQTSSAHRQRVLDLMYPNKTEMDLSLAYPLYFASRGLGCVTENGEKREYRVQAKVYLSGLGADEQLGGYTRHRKAFDRGSWAGLIDELQLDLTRLPHRNLSRDDRLISSFARDARYPFLDLGFISYLSSLETWTKVNPHLPPGSGDKLLIRLAARELGLERAAARVKRAMQFGTRSAKLGGRREGGGRKKGEEEV